MDSWQAGVRTAGFQVLRSLVFVETSVLQSTYSQEWSQRGLSVESLPVVGGGTHSGEIHGIPLEMTWEQWRGGVLLETLLFS